MILSCNSCGKKFVVPDQAITANGRLVQCGSCGNKWKQFPENNENLKSEYSKKIIPEKKIKISKPLKKSKTLKRKVRKKREIDLYSPEYLAKKHGISISDVINSSENEKISFGFYNSLIVLLVFLITFSKGLHFFQDFIVQNLPFTKFYIDYFFESLRNIFEIIKNLVSSY